MMLHDLLKHLIGAEVFRSSEHHRRNTNEYRQWWHQERCRVHGLDNVVHLNDDEDLSDGQLGEEEVSSFFGFLTLALPFSFFFLRHSLLWIITYRAETDREQSSFRRGFLNA